MAALDAYKTWGKPGQSFWGAPLTDYSLTLAVWLVWDILPLSPSTERDQLESLVIPRLETEAAYWSGQSVPVKYCLDSKAEENAWTSEFLIMISQMRAPHPSSGTWLAKRGATIYNDSALDNHDVHPHPHYALASIGMLGEARLAYKLRNVAMPADVQLALTQNVLAVFDQHLSSMDVGGTWNFVGPAARYSHMACTNNCGCSSPDADPILAIADPQPFVTWGGKDDWGTDATSCCNNAFAYATLLNSTYAGVYSQLMDYQRRVMSQAFIRFPTSARPYFPALNRQYYADEVWFHNTGVTFRHVTAHLLRDGTVLVPLTLNEAGRRGVAPLAGKRVGAGRAWRELVWLSDQFAPGATRGRSWYACSPEPGGPPSTGGLWPHSTQQECWPWAARGCGTLQVTRSEPRQRWMLFQQRQLYRHLGLSLNPSQSPSPWLETISRKRGVSIAGAAIAVELRLWLVRSRRHDSRF